MSIKKMVRKISNILIGNINRLLGLKEEVSSPRMEICDTCDHAKQVLLIGKVCDLCGCPCKSKTRAPKEKCKLNKW